MNKARIKDMRIIRSHTRKIMILVRSQSSLSHSAASEFIGWLNLNISVRLIFAPRSGIHHLN
jgi:hypothetical protein